MKRFFPAILLLAGCVVPARANAPTRPTPDARPDVARVAAQADAMIVYEGLPHPRNEPGTRAAEEVSGKKWFKVKNEAFYEKPLPLGATDQTALATILRGPKLLEPEIDLATKLCGGFHADHAVEWKTKDERLAIALICLNCHELMWVQGEKAGVYDIQDEAYTALRALLKNRRQQRPPYGSGEGLAEPPVLLTKPPPLEVPPVKAELKP